MTWINSEFQEILKKMPELTINLLRTNTLPTSEGATCFIIKIRIMTLIQEAIRLIIFILSCLPLAIHQDQERRQEKPLKI